MNITPELRSTIESLEKALGPTPRQIALNQIGAVLATQLDKALTEALDIRLGAGQWTMDSLRGRLTREDDEESASTLWSLDGRTLLMTRIFTDHDKPGHLQATIIIGTPEALT